MLLEDPRRERTQVFQRTKMCKFFILGCCSRGEQCHFAHDKGELQALPDLHRTKLCKTLINTGNCDNPSCKYAHSSEELRVVEGFAAAGISDDDDDAENMAPWGMASSSSNNQASLQRQLAMSWGESPWPDTLHQQVDLDRARAQAAMLQMGQAAQAHAAEAMRLQAMAACLSDKAACLQAQAPGAASFCGFSAGPVLKSGAQVNFPAYGQPWSAGLALPFRASDSGRGGGRGNGGRTGGSGGRNGGKGRGGRDRPGLQSPLQAPVPAPSAPRDAISHNFEPVQLPPPSFKQRAPGNSDMGRTEGSNEPSYVTSGSAQKLPVPGDSAINWKVKNTFLDFEGANTPLASRLRSICSAGGRLDLMAREEDSCPSSPEPSSKQDRDELLGREAMKRSQDPLLPLNCESTTNITKHAKQLPSLPWLSAASGLLGASSGITVKNTFLDFTPEEASPKPHGLRAVHTADGRLDLLAGQE